MDLLCSGGTPGFRHGSRRTLDVHKERSNSSHFKEEKLGRALETAIENFTESLNVCNCTVTSSLQVLLSSDPQNGVEHTEEDYSETPLGHGEKGSEQTSGLQVTGSRVLIRGAMEDN